MTTHIALPSEVDGIFVGGGHNSLVTAAYLGRSGLSTLVLEGHDEIGGGVTTSELTLPLFRHNLHAFFVRWTPDYRVWRDLDLDRFGASAIYPEVQNGLPYDGGERALLSYRDLGPSLDAIRAIDAADADTYARLHEEFSELTLRLLAPLRFAPPLHPDEERELLEGSAMGRRYLELADRSALELVMEWFTSEPLRALMLFQIAVRGYLPNLDVPGTGYIAPLALPASHQTRIIAGGSAEMSRALAGAVYAAGGLVAAGTPVSSIDVRDGRATGVTLADGRQVRARRFVASSVPAPITMLELVGSDHLDPSLAKELGEYRWLEEALFGVHWALGRRPRFLAEDDAPDLPRALNLALGYESSGDIIRDMEALQERQSPPERALHASLPATNDPLQAPPGHHTAFGWQFVASRPEGREDYWDQAAAEAMAKAMADRFAHYASDFDDCVLATGIHSPDDTARQVPSMRYGDRHHGSYHPSNTGYERASGHEGGYATAIDGLYLCGASQHPGGSFTGSPGFNAAGVIARDLHVEPWWEVGDARAIISALD